MSIRIPLQLQPIVALVSQLTGMDMLALLGTLVVMAHIHIKSASIILVVEIVMRTDSHIKSSVDGDARPKRFFSTCSQQRKAACFHALHCHLLQILKRYVRGLRQDGYARYLACHLHRSSVHRISSKIKHHLLLRLHTQQVARYRYHQQVRWWI